MTRDIIVTGIRGLGAVLLLVAIATATAQEREVGPLPSLAPLVDRVAPAVVNIAVTQLVEDRGPFRGGRRGLPLPDDLFRGPPGTEEEPSPRERTGAGSGVIVDAERGYVLTNHHVVEDASEIRVTLVDNRSFDAAIIGSDSHSDLAVLQIDSRGLTAIPFTSSDDLKVGDYVVAIGNPFGFSNTVTAGIVSGLGRQFIEDNDVYEDFIQTDASINPGNSGGALVNLQGELVGINSAIISNNGGGNVGIGFAIPSEMVVSVMDRLLEFGEVRRGLLGVAIDTVTPSFADDYGLDVSSGALVMDVTPGSAAESAGIRINDVIVSVDGNAVGDSNRLRNTVAMKLPNETVEIRVVRDGRERTFDAVLDLNDSMLAELPARREPLPALSVFDGVDLVEIPARSSVVAGLRVTAVERDSRAYQRNLLPGDVITAVNRQSVSTVAEAESIAEATRTIVLEIQRESRARLLRLR